MHHLWIIWDRALFITNADELKSFDLAVLASTHDAYMRRDPSHAATLALRGVPSRRLWGCMLQDGRIVAYQEGTTDIQPGERRLYVVEPSVFHRDRK